MRIITLLARAATVLVLSLGACNDDDGSEPVGGDGDGGVQGDAGGDGDAGPQDETDAGQYLPPPPPVDPWDDVASSIGADVTALHAAMCARFAECGLQVYAVDETACVNFLIGFIYDCDQGLEDLVLPDIEACTVALTEVPCDQLLLGIPNPQACQAATRTLDAATGYALEGEACGSVTFCGTDLTCTGDEQSCGMCVLAPGPGEACQGVCRTGSVCTGPSMDERSCAELLANGAPCTSSALCISSYCNAQGTCATPVVNDRCDADDSCGWVLVCKPSTRVPREAGTCVNAALEGDDCTSVPCGGFLQCVDGQCTVPGQCGQGDVGDTCVPLTPCSHGLVCSANSSSCSAFVPEGGDCDLFGPFCDTGLECDIPDELKPTEWKCVVDDEAPGAACEESDHGCVSGRCVSGKCSASDLGEVCAFDSDCASSACDFGLCVEDHAC